VNKLYIPPQALYDAGQAWKMGGTLGLGLWLSKYWPHFSVKDYGDLIRMVRLDLNDNTDYSKEV